MTSRFGANAGKTRLCSVGIRRVCFAVRDSGQALGARTREKGDAITLEPLRPRTFDRTSPVTAYWLTRCDGFRVAGTRGLATVEGTVFDDDPLHPVALRVRRGAKGTRLISIDAVEAVCPIERVLYLRRRPSAASRAAVGISALGPHGRRAARRTGGGVARAWRFGAPRARAASRATAAAARRKWPAVVQGAVFVVQGAYVLALVLQALVVAAAVAAGRLIRHGLLAA